MLDVFVLDGTVTLVAMAALAVELAVIAGVAIRRGKAPLAHLVANLLSGLFLVLALRAALLHHGGSAVAVFLALAGVAHVADVLMRLRAPS